MVSKEFAFVFIVICGVLSYTFDITQSTVVSSPGDGEDLNLANFDEDDDVMTRLNAVESIDDFLSLMQRNGRPVSMNDSINSPYVDHEGKQVISGGGRLAMPDNCSPRNTTIRISVEGTDSSTAFFPRCTRIERCGGCCTSPNLECVPRYTERVILKVLKGRRPYPGATHLEYNGFAPVIVDRHVACRIQCKLTDALCGSNKRFIANKCVCQCLNMTICEAPTVWDPESCQCKCPQITQCCTNGENCGMAFNHNLCECVLDGAMHIALPSHGNPVRATPSTTRATTTTTTTTTTGSTTPNNPCRNYRCPPRFTKMVRGSSCLCQPPSMRRRNRTRNPNRNRVG